MNQTTLRISNETHKRIKLVAVLNDLTVQDATERIVQAGLEALLAPAGQPVAAAPQAH